MGKLICTEISEGDGLDLTGFLVALVIALILLTICATPPRRGRIIAYRIA
ncbi:hypothetical protein SLEP1_g1228 [Rubroshorea leprosula]|uniref:Uncharacterized protein n=1 Tax=Rubroshorea leprosula TaxID=152421 RepID=A0AAV5HHT6_9ROSI|nr:hypothetical protein SLEP1_g1228 [Rubroshorea leprosula]